MQRVLVTTDFSSSCCHALDYACAITQGKDIALELLHIFPLPVNYTSDAVTLTTLHHSIDQAEALLHDELARSRHAWPYARITGRVTTGGLMENLSEELRTGRPAFIVLGTLGMDDLSLGDDPLEALRNLPAPVLFVPRRVPAAPIRRVAYACNFAHAGPHIPSEKITVWLGLMDAQLSIVHSASHPAAEATEREQEGQHWLEGAFGALQPEFAWVQDDDVISGITGFVSARGIDCVMAVPRRYGIWQSMFHSSRTKALARLNQAPVIAFHERGH